MDKHLNLQMKLTPKQIKNLDKKLYNEMILNKKDVRNISDSRMSEIISAAIKGKEFEFKNEAERIMYDMQIVQCIEYRQEGIKCTFDLEAE